MRNKRHKPEEIVTKLRQIETLIGQGIAQANAIREVHITEQAEPPRVYPTRFTHFLPLPTPVGWHGTCAGRVA